MLNSKRPLIYACLVVVALSAFIVAAGRSEPESQLLDAAQKGDVAQVRRLLDRGTGCEIRDEAGSTPLMVATYYNQLAVVTVLIKAGANVNAKNHIQDSPYLYAGARGLNAILDLTLAHGADLNSTDRFGGTALIPAAGRGHVETVRKLIATGMAVDHVNHLQWTALLEAIILGGGGEPHIRIVQLLLEAGADVHLADGKGVTPLAHARARGYSDIVALLIQAGARH